MQPCNCGARRATISQSDQVEITRCVRCSRYWLRTHGEPRPATAAETAIVEIVESLIRLKLGIRAGRSYEPAPTL